MIGLFSSVIVKSQTALTSGLLSGKATHYSVYPGAATSYLDRSPPPGLAAMVSTNSSPGNSSPQKSTPVLGTFLTAVLAVLALTATALPEIQAAHKSQLLQAPMGNWHPTILVPKN